MNWIGNRVPYRIATGRLLLKCWEPSYAEQLSALVIESADSLLPWMPFAKAPYPTVDEEMNLLRTFRGNYDLGKDYVIGIFDADERAPMGSTGFHLRNSADCLEIGYWIAKRYQGRGYATEAAAALIKIAFELTDVARLEINTAVGNERSQKVIRKLGLQLEGTLRNDGRDAYGKLVDHQKWSMTRSEYLASGHRSLAIRAHDCAGGEIAL